MSTWEELGTMSTKILNDLPNLKKGHRQKTDGVTVKVTTREACASKNYLYFIVSSFLGLSLFLDNIGDKEDQADQVAAAEYGQA